MDLGHLALGHIQLGDDPILRRSDLDHGLVGHDIDQSLVFADLVTLGHVPFDDLALDDALTDIGQNKVYPSPRTALFAGARRRFYWLCRLLDRRLCGALRLHRRVVFAFCLGLSALPIAALMLATIGKQGRMDSRHFTLRHVQPGNDAGFRGGDFHQRLVRHHLDHRLVFGDGITLGNLPFHHLTLDDALADVRQLELCHVLAPGAVSVVE